MRLASEYPSTLKSENIDVEYGWQLSRQCVDRKLACEYPAEVQAAAAHVPVRAAKLQEGSEGSHPSRKSARPAVPKSKNKV